uniref:F-box domain-containing protein n=1 Tax=Panagrolaimus superbus TaxID=310955 RepID=A0A914Z1C8_9BILA
MLSNDLNTNDDLSTIPSASENISSNEIFNFNTIPRTLHERLFELSSTTQLIKLGEISSYCSTLAKKYNGKYPVDRLEIRELQPIDPIHFNQFRYVKTKKQIEYIANPLWETYDPEFLQKINVKRELAFTGVSLKVIDEVMEYIRYSNIISLEIRCNISWENLKKLKTEKITKFLIDGEILDGGTFKEFLELIQDTDYVYAKINMNLPFNAEKIFETWMKTRDKSKKVQLIVIQPLPLPTKLFVSKSFF